MNQKRRAVILLSGGIDSSTTLAIAKDLGYIVHALTFKYGQRHQIELNSALKIARHMGVEEHLTFEVDLKKIAKSALTGSSEVPKKRNMSRISSQIPPTYVPARNLVFLSIAVSWAETLKAERIFIGANAVDFSGYPDCRPEFIHAFQKCANLASKAGVEGKEIVIEAPLIGLTKAEIIKKGIDLGLDYGLTHSCYDPTPDGAACGSCDSCLLRKKGFSEACVADPTRYK